MKIWKRNIAVIFAAVLLGGYFSLSWAGAGWLLMPPRKPVPSSTNEVLAWSGAGGLRVMRNVTESGVPYLLCTPDGVAGPSRRGQILRAQLSTAGVPPGKFGEVRGTLVLLHGWGMRKENLLVTAERFCAVGFRCLIPDLPGHGENPRAAASFGQRPDDRTLPRDVLESAARHDHFDPRPAALWGLSMGGACAVEAASATPNFWAALVVVSTFDALDPLVVRTLDRQAAGFGRLMEPGLSLAVLCRGGFWLPAARPGDRARNLRVPTLIVHGTADDFIPLTDGERLFRAIPDPRKRWLAVEGARHGNVLGTPQAVFAEMATWMLRWDDAAEFARDEVAARR
jgi:pimeloyl-ACP methyl ester carboxylesterase